MGHRAIVLSMMVPLALGACGSAEEAPANVDALDAVIGGNATDPALMGALQDQIMVDPQLAQQANQDAIRPPAQPYSAPIPAESVAAAKTAMPADGELMKAPAPSGQCDACDVQDKSVTLAGLAAGQRSRGAAQCAAKLNYSAGWAARLPGDMPLHPQGRVSEAAGADGNGCSLRVVSFSTPQPLGTMIDWYYTRAVKGGYGAEHQAKDGLHVLGGTRNRDGAAYIAFLSARGDGGTDIDLIVDQAK